MQFTPQPSPAFALVVPTLAVSVGHHPAGTVSGGGTC
jgi:hypothetical protein